MTQRPSEGRGTWNRAGRRSGGSKPAPIAPRGAVEPPKSIQCFEHRCRECTGEIGLFPGRCQCECHKR